MGRKESNQTKKINWHVTFFLRSLENKGDHISSWTGGSFLSAVSSHSSNDSDGCVCLVEDVEQTDENFEDVSQIVAEEETEGLSLEDVVRDKI